MIVQLRVPAGSDDKRVQAIQETQQMLLKELARASHRVVRTYTTIPAILLSVSTDALQILAGSSLVLRVDEDQLMKILKECVDSAPSSRSPESCK